jgi:predicted N-acetyltransferase YhbS
MANPATAVPAGEITLRPADPADAETLARICFEAFGQFHDYHRFPRDFPAIEAAAGLMDVWTKHPSIWGIVAERDGRIVGSNFLDERSPIRGVGPITVDPEGQNAGAGRRLMEAVIERGAGAPGIRLLQDSFHMRSLSLYESLGFDVKEPVVVMSGEPGSGPPAGVDVRPLAEDDVEECEALCKRVHGFERTNELRDAMHAFTPYVASRGGNITAYVTTVTFWPMAHGVGESDEDLQGLLLGAAARTEGALTFLAPIRWPLFRWALGHGLRAVKPMNLMAMGEYREPRGAWFPNVLY